MSEKHDRTTADRLDARMVAHILGGAWAKIDDLEGNTWLETLKYFESYLSEYPKELPKEIILNLDGSNKFSLAIDIEKETLNTNNSCEDQIKNINKKITAAISKLKSSKDSNYTLIIPGGWSGLPADLETGEKQHTGHAMYYFIKPDPDNKGKFIFGVLNAGSGLEYHSKKTTAGGKTIYLPSVEWGNLTEEQVADPKMLEQLMKLKIDPLRYTKGHTKDEKRPCYSAGDIYSILNKSLGHIQHKASQIEDYITPQRIGNCTWKSLMMTVRKSLDQKQYKRFLNDLKFNTLETLYRNLSTQPVRYDEKHHLLMIKALLYGAQKMAKTLEKRKEIFTEQELKDKTSQAQKLLKQAKELQKDYLKKHPGKLTEQNLPNSLRNLKVDVTPSSREEKIKKIVESKISSLSTIGQQQKIKTKPIVIPKSYNPDSSKAPPTVEEFIDNLKKCLKYANQIKTNQALRSFLTHNVFNCLPVPPKFWSNFKEATQMLDCLNVLDDLSSLYVSVVYKDSPPLPEHKYNSAKVFSIGKFLTQQYAKSTSSLQDVIKEDTFSLPLDLKESLSKGVESLDPYFMAEWDKLTKAEKFDFRRSIYENKPSETIDREQLTSSSEFKLYMHLSEDSKKESTDTEKIQGVLALMNYRRYNRESYELFLDKSWTDMPWTALSLEQKTLLKCVRVMQNFSKRNIYLAKENVNNYLLNLAMIPYEGYAKFSIGVYGDASLNTKDFYKKLYNQLPEPYLSALENHDKISTQSDFLLNSNKEVATSEIYNIKLISNAPWQSDAQPTKLMLLLDYFESLPDNKQNDPNLLEFFKQISILHIDSSIKQLEQHPLLADRLINFFNKEFNNISSNLSGLENPSEYINRYLCFQRIVHKMYSVLRERRGKIALTTTEQHLYTEFEKSLVNTREQLINWCNKSNSELDNGQMAVYGLASFGHLQASHDRLSDDDLKKAVIFSTKVGIYGFGKQSERYDLFLKKDLYDVRLKIAEQIESCSPALKQELLALCLQTGFKANGMELNIDGKSWQESDPYYFIYNANNDLIQINLTEGIILINGKQLIVNNIPNDLAHSLSYKKIFGEESIEVIYQNDSFIPQKKSLRNLIIKKDPAVSAEPNIFWMPPQSLHIDDQAATYVLLQDLEKLQLPTSLSKGDFTYWAKVTNDPKKYKILIAPKNCGKEPQPFLEILSDGRIVKLTDDKLSLSVTSNVNDILKFVENLGCHVDDVLTWQDNTGNISKIEIPLGDEQGNWLSFDRKEENGITRWYWSQDPNYYISEEQVLGGRPSITNFVLLENKDGKQKALFANIKESDSIGKKTAKDPSKLDTIYPPAGKPHIKYIEIDVEPSSELKTQAKLIESSKIGDVSNLYIVYLKLMQPENEPSDASILLNKQRPLRRYTTEELEMLWRIIDSKDEQASLNRESIHPDAVVTRTLACYLVKSNLEKYPFSKEEVDSFASKNARLYEIMFYNYQALVNLPKASGRGKLNNFISKEEIQRTLWIAGKNSDKKFVKLEPPLVSPKSLLEQYQITEQDLKSLSSLLASEQLLLSQKEQEICKNINDISGLDAPKRDKLQRKRIAGKKYDLTIDDAVYLYLKQNASLWEKHTGLDVKSGLEKIHGIQDQIINYLLLKVKIQEEQRILAIQTQMDQLDPSSEDYKALEQQKNALLNTKRSYDPIKHPAFLIYEAIANITLRPEQINKFKQLLTDTGEHVEQQLEIIMGMGKSKVLSPLLSHAKADGEHLSMLVLTDPLYSSGSQDMQKSLGLLGTKTETIEYSRQTSSLAKLQQLQAQIKRAIEEGTVCTARVKDLQTIGAMPEVLLEEIYQSKKSGTYTYELQREQEEKIRILLDINKTLKEKGLFTLDELDTQLYSRQQLNLPIGGDKSIPVIGTTVATKLFLMLISEDFNGVPIKDWLLNNNQTFLSPEDFEAKIKPRLAEKIFATLNLETITGIDLKTCFMAYMGVGSGSLEENKKNSELFYNSLTKLYNSSEQSDTDLVNKLAMYRMQLADGKLQESLSKCANAQFGRSKLQPELEIVIPYAASNQPKESSKAECAFFKDSWETVNKTLIYYISSKWQDLNQTKNFVIFLRNSVDLKNNASIANIFGTEIYTLLISEQWNTSSTLTRIMNKIEEQRQAGNVELLTLLFNYLEESVFPEQIKSYDIQANSTAYDFAAIPKKLNGYSGTRRGEKTWHDRLKRDELQGVEDNIHQKLLNQDNPNHCFSDITTRDPAALMQHLSSLQDLKNYSSFIDAGALFKELSNLEIAKLLLEKLPNREAIAFYYEVSPGVTKLALIKKDALEQPIIVDGSGPEQIAKALNCSVKELETKLFNFYDQAHIVGSDLPNPPKGRAFMTFSEQLGKDLMNQGIMRMRKFMEQDGQHVDFLVTGEIKQIILQHLKIADSELTLKHLIDHAKLVQDDQEKQDYYNALHQKLQHEIKNYLTTKIRKFLSNNQHDPALELYKRTREFLLFLEGDDLFSKYGRTVELITPKAALANKVKILKDKLDQLKLGFDDSELGALKTNLDKIIDVEDTALPEKIASNTSSDGGEVEVSAEQQAEQQQEQQQEQQHVYNLTPSKNVVLGIPEEQGSYLQYLQNIKFDKVRSLKEILSEKITLEKEKSSKANKKWQAYSDMVVNNGIGYSEDALRVFNEIDPIKGALTKYQKPIHQVLIVEETIEGKKELKVIVLSAQESANFAISLSRAREEAKSKGKTSVLQDRKMWLVSPNGEALDGTDKWVNPFKPENTSLQTKPFMELLLQTLVLQKNTKFLAELLKQPQLRAMVNDWFVANKDNLEEIFGKEKFKELEKITAKHKPPSNIEEDDGIEKGNKAFQVDQLLKQLPTEGTPEVLDAVKDGPLGDDAPDVIPSKVSVGASNVVPSNIPDRYRSKIESGQPLLKPNIKVVASTSGQKRGSAQTSVPLDSSSNSTAVTFTYQSSKVEPKTKAPIPKAPEPSAVKPLTMLRDRDREDISEKYRKHFESKNFVDTKYTMVYPNNGNDHTIGKITSTKKDKKLLATVRQNYIECPVTSVNNGKLSTVQQNIFVAFLEIAAAKKTEKDKDKILTMEANNFSPSDLTMFLNLLKSHQPKILVNIKLPEPITKCVYGANKQYKPNEYKIAQKLIEEYNNSLITTTTLHKSSRGA